MMLRHGTRRMGSENTVPPGRAYSEPTFMIFEMMAHMKLVEAAGEAFWVIRV